MGLFPRACLPLKVCWIPSCESQHSTMRKINSKATITIPEGVTVDVKCRTVTVKGPRGTLTRTFKHLQLELRKSGDNTILVDSWFATRKELACVRTICSHIENMFKGVTYGFQYHMKSVYAHFPINLTIVDGGKTLNVRNFLGEKIVRVVPLHDGVTVKAGEKDEIILQGNDIEKVSLSSALVHQCCMVKKKDIRKFLDGIYVSKRTTVDPLPEM